MLNPCQSGNGGCQHLCILTQDVNGYRVESRCACDIGYVLSRDGKSCQGENLKKQSRLVFSF